MGVFLYHPQNKVAQDLAEMTQSKGFQFNSRGHLEMIVRKQLTDLGVQLYPDFITTLGSLAGAVDLHIELNPDNPLEMAALKKCKDKAPWSFVKIKNGRSMNCVIGYCDVDPSAPFIYTPMQMILEGHVDSSFHPGFK